LVNSVRRDSIPRIIRCGDAPRLPQGEHHRMVSRCWLWSVSMRDRPLTGLSRVLALNHPIRVLPSRGRVLEAVDINSWLVGDGGRDNEQRRQAQYPGDLG
jgi:hypothetical protein